MHNLCAALAALEVARGAKPPRPPRRHRARASLPHAMTVVTIGDIAMVGIPGELFVELGLALKAQSALRSYFRRRLLQRSDRIHSDPRRVRRRWLRSRYGANRRRQRRDDRRHRRSRRSPQCAHSRCVRFTIVKFSRCSPSGAQIVDVLPSHEYSRRAHQAARFTFRSAKFSRDAPHLLDSSRPVVVYCRDSL